MLIADIVMIMKNRFMPIARRYKIGKIVDMLHKHTEETRVRDCIKYYNQTMSD